MWWFKIQSPQIYQCETLDSCCREPLCGLLKVVATECEKLLLDGTPPPTCPFFLAKNSQCVWTKKKCQTTCQLIQPLVGLSNWGPAYCQETCLLCEKSRMQRLCILTQDWHFSTICLKFVFSNIWIYFMWRDSTRRWDRFFVNLESWNQILRKGKFFFLSPKIKGKWLVAVITSSQKRSPDGRRADNLRCRNNYPATCVRRHLQVGAAFSITSRPTARSNTTAHSATSTSLRKAF